MSFLSACLDWLEKFQLPCVYKTLFGIECPGCGMQRAIIYLLKGNIIESIKMYPPLIPLLIMFGFLATHLIFKFKHGAKMLIWLFVFNVCIITINYLYKLLI